MKTRSNTISRPQLPVQDVVLLIPVYQPDQKLLEVVDGINILLDKPRIVVVNDGSTSPGAAEIFKALKGRGNIQIVNHKINLGKGKALKRGFQYIYDKYNDYSYVVTLDGDGQHLPKDILKICESLKDAKGSLCIGVRNFVGEMPLRSRFGNFVTTRAFKLFVGKELSDTQSGLRAIPTTFLPQLIKTDGSGYEYELQMLVEAVAHNIEIKEVRIETIYLDENSSSHFNPLLDSVRVYFVFMRYLSTSLLATLIDYMIFAILYFFGEQLFVAVTVGRLISSYYRYYFNKKYVFKSAKYKWREALLYSLLTVQFLIMSFILTVYMRDYMELTPYYGKIIADISLFLLSFCSQQTLIFKMFKH